MTVVMAAPPTRSKRKTTTKVTFKASRGARFNNKDADLLGRTLMKLYGIVERVTPEQVLEAAKNPRSPLHRFFDWNDKSAARKFRIDQARYILRHINIVYLENGEEVETRAFQWATTNPEEGDHTYMPVVVAFSNPNYKEQIVGRARGEVEGWIARYQQYTELKPAVKLAQKIVDLLSTA